MEQLREVVEEHQVKMAVLCVLAEAAQSTANLLMQAGVTGILNFAPMVLHAQRRHGQQCQSCHRVGKPELLHPGPCLS